MDQPEKTGIADHDLFLIELIDGEQARYVVAERFLTIDPGQEVMGVPWTELAALFKGRTLRAVPLPGRRDGAPPEASLGQAGRAGAPINVEGNLVKVEKDG